MVEPWKLESSGQKNFPLTPPALAPVLLPRSALPFSTALGRAPTLSTQTFLHVQSIEKQRLPQRARELIRARPRLFSLNLRLAVSTAVRIHVADPTLRPETFFMAPGYENCRFYGHFGPNPFSAGRTFRRNEAGEAAGRPGHPVSPNSLVHGRSSVHGSISLIATPVARIRHELGPRVSQR